jgi:hypothetical protein
MSAQMIPTPDGAAQFVEISQTEWTDLNQRAHFVVQDKAIATEITKTVPNYPDLLKTCEDWIETTFPGMIQHAIYVAGFSTQAADTLDKLQTDLDGVKPGDPVPDNVSFLIRVNYQALAQSAANIIGELDPLDPLVTEFVQQNQEADKALEKEVSQFGSGWESLVDPLGALDYALAKVGPGWTEINNGLSNIANGTIEITTAGLLSSDLISAGSAWRQVGAAAAAFDQWAGG